VTAEMWFDAAGGNLTDVHATTYLAAPSGVKGHAPARPTAVR
jgi:hypothetical protein